ncbi:MAG: tripartite tricarboxylate transporter substrate binding protein [Burkholderiales bacterium]|nr:tripartite tricarboxylate transporter substrate binding protein [Burkholderiales bacterium]
MTQRRNLLKAAGVLALPALPYSGATRAQGAYPNRPVRLVVPFGAGGATDIIARLVSQKLTELWGQSVVVDYKPGAGTVLGTDFVAKSAPDGYTLGMVITAHVINPSLRPTMPYDTLRDLSGVSLVAISHILLAATPGLEANNLRELIALAKSRPLSYATPGTGTAMHLAGELFKTQTGLDLTHVPYRGGAAAYPDVIAGRVPLIFDPMFASMGHVRAGKLKAIAITSAERAASNPEIGTFAEAVPGFDVKSISGIVAPSATPREIVRKVSADVGRVLAMADVKSRMAEVGMEPSPATPEAFDAFIRREIERWAPVVRASGAKAAD